MLLPRDRLRAVADFPTESFPSQADIIVVITTSVKTDVQANNSSRFVANRSRSGLRRTLLARPATLLLSSGTRRAQLHKPSRIQVGALPADRDLKMGTSGSAPASPQTAELAAA